MAAVAGSIAEHVGKDLLRFSPEIIVGKGIKGDCYYYSQQNENLGKGEDYFDSLNRNSYFFLLMQGKWCLNEKSVQTH